MPEALDVDGARSQVEGSVQGGRGVVVVAVAAVAAVLEAQQPRPAPTVELELETAVVGDPQAQARIADLASVVPVFGPGLRAGELEPPPAERRDVSGHELDVVDGLVGREPWPHRALVPH